MGFVHLRIASFSSWCFGWPPPLAPAECGMQNPLPGLGGGGGGGGAFWAKKGPEMLHYKTPPGGCSNAHDPPVVQKRWKNGPVEPFFRCFRKYPPQCAKNKGEIVGVVGGG